jgi:hypothetical protein
MSDPSLVALPPEEKLKAIADYWATVQLGPEHEIKTPEEDIKYRCEGWCSPCLAPWMGLP